MAQYTYIEAGSPLELDNGVNQFRYAVSGLELLLQQYVASAWATIRPFGGSGTGKFRVGARSGYWNIDEALDAIGFGGTQGVNWKTLERHKLS